MSERVDELQPREWLDCFRQGLSGGAMVKTKPCKQDVFCCEASGNFTSAGLRDGLLEFLNDPDTIVGMKLLIDVRHVVDNPTSRELQNIADSVAKALPAGVDRRVAMVVSGDLQYGLGRMLEVYLQRWKVRLGVFRSKELAMQYLLE